MAQCLNYVWFWSNQFEYLCRIIDCLKAFHGKISTHSHKNNIPEVKLNTSSCLPTAILSNVSCSDLFSIHFKNFSIPTKCILLQDDNSGISFWRTWRFLKISISEKSGCQLSLKREVSRYCQHKTNNNKWRENLTQGHTRGILKK